MSSIRNALPLTLFRALPRRALALDVAFPPSGRRSHPNSLVLVLGPVDDQLVHALGQWHVSLSYASSAPEFVVLLQSNDYHAVLVSQEAHGGLSAVRAVKLREQDPALPPDSVHAAAARHRRTPFFIMPRPDEIEYALILAPPSLAFLLSREDIGFAEAVARVDPQMILKTAPA